MNVYIALKEDQEEILKRLKEYRKTTNSSQIIREALYAYEEKIFGNSIYTSIEDSLAKRSLE